MKDIKGLNVKKLSFFLIALEAILITFSIVSIVNVYSNHKKVDVITDDYIGIQKNIYDIQLATDLLSAKSRQYVMTEEMSFAYEYFKEVNETKRRDNAVRYISEVVSSIGHGATEPIDDALIKSNKLIERELHAMALIATLDNKNPSEYIPEELKSYELSAEELKYSPEAKKDKAYSLVFGGGYSYEKLSIREC